MAKTPYIAREIERNLRSHLDRREILAVLGPRRSGKTTVVRHLLASYEKVTEISFDDQELRLLFEKSVKEFVRKYVRTCRYLFIDEFQYAHEGGRLLKYIVDDPACTTKIIISGSSADDLTIRSIRYLVGRVTLFEVYPFSFREYLLARHPSLAALDGGEDVRPLSPAHAWALRHAYEDYLCFGGYPQVVLAKTEEEKRKRLRDLVNTLFLREVRDLLGLIDDEKLYALLKALAAQIGGLVTYDDLARVSGYSFPALKKYLNFLQKTFVIRLARPYYTNPRTEIVKNPKIFFCDTGLRNALLDDFRSLDDRRNAGSLLENGVAMEYLKRGYALQFWRDKEGNEVDFIINKGDGVIIGVEVKKSAERTATASLAALRRAHPQVRSLTLAFDRNRRRSSQAQSMFFLP